MTCEDISKKALELNINPNHIIIVKEVFNGWRIDLKYPVKINRIIELKKYIKTK